MKHKFREILLSWRKGRGSSRHIVGRLKRTSTNGITFKYLKDGVDKAKLDGFKEYPGFPIAFDVPYQENDLDVFSLRLVPFERKDNIKLLKFWEAEGITDKFDLLGLTQGFLPTDNFEFLGHFYPKKGFKFVTDIAGLSHLQLTKNSVSKGDKLTYEIETNTHAYQNRAVKIFKSEEHIGYIKNVHNCTFLLSKGKIKLTVKEVEQNGIIKNVFILVETTF